MFRTIAATIAAILALGVAGPASATRYVPQYPPAPTFYGYDVTGSYANGFTAVNEEANETLTFPSWRTAIDACKQEFAPNTYKRAACRANERQIYRNLKAQRDIGVLNG